MSAATEAISSNWRAAVIGCGRIGADGGPPTAGASRIHSHAQAYNDCPRTELSALSDMDGATMNRAGDKWQVRARYQDPAVLLAEAEPEIVSICTPAAGRIELLEAILATPSVRAVLLEKPLAASVAEADTICRMAGASKTILSVDFCRRFPPAYRDAAARIKSGGLGKIQHVAGYYTKGVVNNGGHLLDLLRWWFGEPLTVQPLSRRDEAPDPGLDLAMTFPHDVVAWLRALDGTACNIFEVDVIGTEGRLVFRDQGHQLDDYVVADTRAQHGFRQFSAAPVTTATGLAGAVRLAIDDLIGAVEHGRCPAFTVQDGRAALALSLNAIDAARHLG